MSSILFYSTRMKNKFRNFFEFYLKSPVSRIVPKIVKVGPFGIFEHPFCCKIEKNEGGPFGDIKQIYQKKSHKAEITFTKKFLVKGGTRTPVLLLGRPQKAELTSMPSASGSSVAVSVNGSQLIKLMKSVTWLVLKNKKSLL